MLAPYAELFLTGNARAGTADLSPEALLKFLRARFAFFDQRPRGPFVLRIESVSPANGGGPGGAAGDGADNSASLIEIVTDDRPFLLASIRLTLAARGLEVRALYHPILAARRGAGGSVEALGESADGARRESHIVLLVEALSTAARADLRGALTRTLTDVIAGVDCFPEVGQRLDGAEAVLRGLKGGESRGDLLRWFRDDNFIFLGLLPFTWGGKAGGGARKWRAVPGDALGLLRATGKRAEDATALAAQVIGQMERLPLDTPRLRVGETSVQSRVQREEFLTTLLISPGPAPGRAGAPVPGWAVVGLFTNRSLRSATDEIPAVWDRIEGVLRACGLVPNSHSFKEAVDFLNGLPKLEVFRLLPQPLEAMVRFFLSNVQEPRTDVAFLPDAAARAVRAMVSLPQRYFPPDKMVAVRTALEASFGASARNGYAIRVGELSFFGLYFAERSLRKFSAGQREKSTQRVQRLLRSREDLLVERWLQDAAEDAQGREKGGRGRAALSNAMAARAAARARDLIGALPEEYKVTHQDEEVVADMHRLDRLMETGRRQFTLRTANAEAGSKLVFYGREHLSLSRIMPVLTNLRLHVLEERTFELALPQGPGYLQYFYVRLETGDPLNPDRDRERLLELLFRILDDHLENDPLNALLVTCRFTWRQVGLMLLLRNFLMQIGTVYTKSTINETLVRRPAACGALFGIFQARFDPEASDSARGRRQRAAEAALLDAMAEIDNLTEDRIFKRLLNLIQAAVRTNYFRDPGEATIAVKFASRELHDLPPPHPLYEIYVQSPLMEGVHLRGGMVARGGIRYSDRPDDFRTEVLGLMATQMKKNALIVPVGSKGGFVVKNAAPYGGDPRQAGDAQYRVFMHALLSVTDNLVAGAVVPPERVVRHDGDDPYLVVAADKGTAHLSDTANAISREHGFWLGDAFASGGSAGYDHKAVGITARGGWESVKRHFWEMGVDLGREPVRVVGIGDMGGDVFGNGLLLSDTLKLVGAFNHQHIFIDPDPDPARSFAERRRLFRLPRTTWEDYNPALLSAGGGIYPRRAKSISLSPQARKLLGTTRAELSGEEAVRALLSAPVDLIWNGGIGTYIKGDSESDAEVGDHANDAVRISAGAVRGKVVGEGGNLGLTQAARVALDLKGVHLNTDAIDNAGGVHLSDQEVNLKILLRGLMEKKLVADLGARDRLMGQVQHSVAAGVVHRNYLQTIAMSMDRLRSQTDVEPFVRLLNLLAAEGRIDRRAEGIPNAERFQQWQAQGLGIPRPMLAVLLSSAKMALVDRLGDAPMLADPAYARFFVGYFPAALARRFNLEQAPHPLRPQIIATTITNQVSDQAGMTFVPELATRTGRAWTEVVAAYLVADEACGARALRDALYALDYRMAAGLQYELLMRIEDFLADVCQELLMLRKEGAPGFDEAPALRKGLAGYLAARQAGAAEKERRRIAENAKEWSELGLAGALAEKLAWLPRLRGFLAASRLAETWSIRVPVMLSLERELERHFRFAEIEADLAAVPLGDMWRKQFGDGLHRALHRGRQQIVESILRARRGKDSPESWVRDFLAARPDAWRDYEATWRRVREGQEADLVALAVLVGMLERFN